MEIKNTVFLEKAPEKIYTPSLIVSRTLGARSSLLSTLVSLRFQDTDNVNGSPDCLAQAVKGEEVRERRKRREKNVGICAWVCVRV